MFSVLTFNMRFGLADDGGNSWQSRKKAFSPLLNTYSGDFICFQEANAFQVDFLKEILAEYDFIGKRSPAPSFWQNNIIFYQKSWKCIYCKHFFLSPTPMIPSRFRESRWPRQCTLGMFKKRDRRLICINTHFDFDAEVQVKSAAMIMEQLSMLPPELPAMIVGDFNATPLSPCHNVFTGQNHESNIEDLYLKNVFVKPFPGTHHGFTGDKNGDHIDWILYRGRIISDNCEVIYGTFNGVYPSDHFPVFATFKWK